MKIAIIIENEAEYNELMERLESKGYLWGGSEPALQVMYNHNFKIVNVRPYSNILTRSSYVDNTDTIPFTDLKANDFKLTIQL